MNPRSLLQRIVGAMLGIALFIAAFIFASVLLAIAATAALLIWGWLWWRTREIRRDAREGDNVVIEGEYRVERESRRLDDD
ncbi:MAG: hypothetical protein WCA17_05420 [Burkholderiales bacterium]